MATRRAGTGRAVQRRRSPNFAVVTRGGRSVRRLVKAPASYPGVPMLTPSNNKLRGVRTLMKRNIADGMTQPEAKRALLTNRSILPNGVSIDERGQFATVISKSKVTPPLKNQRRVKTPRPAPGGVRNPFGKRSI